MTIHELEKNSPGAYFYDVKDQLKTFIYKRSEEAFIAGDTDRDLIKSIEELEKRKSFIREKLIESLGGLPPRDTPLNAVVVDVLHCKGYKIEKIIFESRPKAYVTANLYIPEGITEPRGAVLFLCGHFNEAKHHEEYQTVCLYLVNAGLVVMAQDPIGQGERLSYYEENIGRTTIDWGVMEHDYAGSQCWLLGDGIARYFVHDAMRGIDYLCTRPEVDPQKIGVTGNSGGGTQTSLVMVCDTRVAAAAPATFIMNRQTYMYSGMAQDSEQIWPRMTAIGFDHEDILMAMLPHPVLVLAVSSDFFPIEGTRRTVERIRRFCEMYGKTNLLELYEDDSDHHYTRPMAKAAAEFFSFHLLGRVATPRDEDIKTLEPYRLCCTRTGQIRGEMKDARFVYEENIDRLEELEMQRRAEPDEICCSRAFEWLKEIVFKNRKPCRLNPRQYDYQQVNELMVQMYIWRAQEDYFNNAFVFRDYRFTDQKLPATIAVWDGGTGCIQQHIDWIRKECASGRTVVVLDTAGVGNIMPKPLNSMPPNDFLGVIFKLTHDLMWLNDSLAAIRVYDIIRALDAIELIKETKKEDIRLYAFGRQGFYALLAAFLDERVQSIAVDGGIESFSALVRSRYYNHYDIMSIILPGMLKYFDLPDIYRWIGMKWANKTTT